jgi:hypothetical protein
LITKAPHFLGYLRTSIIPTAFFTAQSVKYRTLAKYRRNIHNNPDMESETLFDLFEVSGKREKEAVLRGLENLI